MNGGALETGPALESHYRFLLWLVPTAECGCARICTGFL